MKRSLKTISAVVLTASLLAACSSKEEPAAPANSPDQSKTGATTPAKQQLTLRILIDSPANAKLPAANEDFVLKKIEEKFNVKLQVDYNAAGNDYTNKLNAQLAANDPPDMWRDTNGDGGQKYALDGLLGDMTNIVTPQAMPNYFKYWVDEPTLKGYQVFNQFLRAPLPYNKEVYRAWYIRKDWLDTLGLQIPKTYDEYLNVLRAFTKKDPDGNGKNDTYGFTTAGGGTTLGLEWPEYQKNGLISAAFLENNTFIDGQTDPRIEGVLNDIIKVIGEGLVDPDWLLNKNPQHIDKAAQGKAGVVYGTVKELAFDSNPQGLQTKTKQLFPKANWVPFTPFGSTPIASGVAPGSPFLFPKGVIDKQPEKAKRIAEILDWLASEEGFIMTHYGLENKHFTRSGSTITLKPEAIQEDIIKKGDWLAIWDFFTPNTPKTFGLTVVDPLETERDREITKAIAAIPIAPYIGASLTPPQGFDLGTYRAKQREMQVKAVLEDKSGKNWPKYREELMTKFEGNKLHEAYTALIKAAGLIK